MCIQVQLTKELRETVERINVVEKGLIEYIKLRTKETAAVLIDQDKAQRLSKTKLYVYNPAKDPKEVTIEMERPRIKFNPGDNTQERQDKSLKKYTTVKEKIETISKLEHELPKIELSDKDKAILRRLELEHEKNIKGQNTNDNVLNTKSQVLTDKVAESTKIIPNGPEVKPKPSVRPKQTVRHLHILRVTYMLTLIIY